MRVEMVAAIVTTAAQFDPRLDERKRAIARAGSDDDADDVEPGEDSDSIAGKSVATRHVNHTYVDDSDDDSLSSSEGSSNSDRVLPNSSSEDDIDGKDNGKHTSASRFRTRQNPIFEQQKSISTSVEGKEPGKQLASSVLQDEDEPEGNDEGNCANVEVGERSRLMAAAQAASIPSDDDYFSDDKGDYARGFDERSRLMAASQAASTPTDDDFADDEENLADEVDARSRLMCAAQAASIPSDNSFSDDEIENNGFRDSRSCLRPMPKTSQTSKGTSSRGMQTDAKPHHDNKEHESDEGSSSLSDETEGERSSSDEDPEIEFRTKTRRSQKGYVKPLLKPRRLSRNTTAGEEEDPDDGLSGSERGSNSGGSDVRKPKKNEANSASFPPKTASFNWANVKTKVFYSFRALKGGAISSSDGSRTISVKNLAREVTEHHLRDFFQDCGIISEVWITRVPQSGLRTAYLDFESGDAARKALGKSGKKLEGRVIVCDITYENSKGSHTGPDSSHGVRENSRGGHSGPDSSHGARETTKVTHSGPDSVGRGVRERSIGSHSGQDSSRGVRENLIRAYSGPDSVRVVRESSKGNQSGPDLGRGARHRLELFESDSASFGGGMMENQSGLQIFPPELQDGDEKFLSRFKEQANISLHGSIQCAAGNPKSISTSRHKEGVVSRGLPRDLPTATRPRELPKDLPTVVDGGRNGVVLAPWRESFEVGFADADFLTSGKTQAEIEQSIYYDAKNLEAEPRSLGVGWKIAWPWGRRQRLFWPWKWPYWEGEHSTNPASRTWSSKWARRKSSNLRATELKLIDKKPKSSKVRSPARRKTSRNSRGHMVIDTKRKNVTAVNCESVQLWC